MRSRVAHAGRGFDASLYLTIAITFMIVYYGAALSDWSMQILKPTPRFGMTFNSMLQHLLQGRFDVDPAAIEMEGYLREGKTYAYFGILPAVLRLAVMPFLDLNTTDVTRLSCLLAACVAGYFSLRALLCIRESTENSGLRALIFAALTASIVLGGPQLQFLTASIYQEAISWGTAFAMAFVHGAIRGLVSERRFTPSSLAQMAIAAGLALLTRVSTGIGLYAALALLLLLLAGRIVADVGSDSGPRSGMRAIPLVPLFVRLRAGGIVTAFGLLLLFAALCGLVNYGRWGSPFTFVDFHYYLMNTVYPDRLARVAAYGEFNLARLGYGIMYYLFPVWIFRGADGHFLFQDFQQRLLDAIELPPGSFLLTDPLLIGLAVIFLSRLRGAGRVLEVRHSLALLAGSALTPLLLLTALAMSFRYRMEFYPVLELAAFLGFFLLCSGDHPIRAGSGLRSLVWSSTAVAILASHLLMVLYKVSPVGPVTSVAKSGALWDFYIGLFTR